MYLLEFIHLDALLAHPVKCFRKLVLNVLLQLVFFLFLEQIIFCRLCHLESQVFLALLEFFHLSFITRRHRLQLLNLSSQLLLLFGQLSLCLFQLCI